MIIRFSLVPLDCDFLLKFGGVLRRIVPSGPLLSVGKRVTNATVVLRGNLPALLGLLLGLVILLCRLPCHARGCNFPVVKRLALGHIVHELVHLGDSLVVFLETVDLTVQEAVLLVTHLQVLLQTVHVAS